MKNFLTKYFGLIGLFIYFVLSTLVRIPAGLFLAVFCIVLLLVWGPITRKEPNLRWMNGIYDWYWSR